MKIVQIQIVLYRNSLAQLESLFSAISMNMRWANLSPEQFRITLVNNDPKFLTRDQILAMIKIHFVQCEINIEDSDTNIGHGAGHNFLSKLSGAKYLWIINPDGIPAPDCLTSLMQNFRTSSKIGVAEARQIPFDHPKSFDPVTHSVNWASGACFLVRQDIFLSINGFDELFFLHGDDVDLSWRIRDLGWELRYSPGSRFFHDKTLASNGHPTTSVSEQFYGPLGALLLARKYSLDRGLSEMLNDLEKVDSLTSRRILSAYRELEDSVQALILQDPSIPTYLRGWNFSPFRF